MIRAYLKQLILWALGLPQDHVFDPPQAVVVVPAPVVVQPAPAPVVVPAPLPAPTPQPSAPELPPPLVQMFDAPPQDREKLKGLILWALDQPQVTLSDHAADAAELDHLIKTLKKP